MYFVKLKKQAFKNQHIEMSIIQFNVLINFLSQQTPANLGYLYMHNIEAILHFNIAFPLPNVITVLHSLWVHDQLD